MKENSPETTNVPVLVGENLFERRQLGGNDELCTHFFPTNHSDGKIFFENTEKKSDVCHVTKRFDWSVRKRIVCSRETL